MSFGEKSPRASELMGPDLTDDEIADIRAVFESIVDSIRLHDCCSNVMYSNWSYFTAIIQRQHSEDIIYQVSESIQNTQTDLRLRIESFSPDTEPGMTSLDYIRPRDAHPYSTPPSKSRSIIIACNRDELTSILRRVLVMTKTYLVKKSRLELDDVPGEEGTVNYSLADFNTEFVGEESIFS